MRFIFHQIINDIIVAISVECHCDSDQMMRLTALYQKGGHKVKVFLGGVPGQARYLPPGALDGVLCHETF